MTKQENNSNRTHSPGEYLANGTSHSISHRPGMHIKKRKKKKKTGERGKETVGTGWTLA